jgi:hypothetical protein
MLGDVSIVFENEENHFNIQLYARGPTTSKLLQKLDPLWKNVESLEGKGHVIGKGSQL